MTLGTADRVAPGDLKMTSKHILYVHGQSTGTGRAEFSWSLPPLLLLLVLVSSVALVGYRGRSESGVSASTYGEETTTCYEDWDIGILPRVFFPWINYLVASME